MKRWALAAGVIIVIFCSTVARADFIEVRADSWMPYNGDPDSDRPGYCVEILKAIFETQGHLIRYQIRPWSRATALVANNRVDAIIAAGRRDCPTCLYPREPAGISFTYFYVNADDPWMYEGIASLDGKFVGVIDGYAYDGAALDEFVSKGQVPYVQKATGDKAIDLNIRKLREKRLDIVVENPLVMHENLKRLDLPPDLFRPAGNVEGPQELYIAFAPGKESSARYAELWDKGMESLRRSGELDRILSKYGLQDWRSGERGR